MRTGSNRAETFIPPRMETAEKRKIATQRIPKIVAGALLALAIAAAGSYYGLAVSGGGAENDGLSSDAPGRPENVIEVSGYFGQPDDYSREFAKSETVVMGLITHLSDAKWTTSDSVAPEELTREVLKNSAIHIRTPAVLDVTQVFKGQVSKGDPVKFSFPGGKVGDTAFVHGWNEVLEEDATVIVFLSRGGDGSPSKLVQESGLFPTMHLLVRGDMVEGPLKEVPLADIVEQLKEDGSESSSDGEDK